MMCLCGEIGFEGSKDEFCVSLRIDFCYFFKFLDEVGVCFMEVVVDMEKVVDDYFIVCFKVEYGVCWLEVNCEGSFIYGIYELLILVDFVGCYCYNGFKFDQCVWINLCGIFLYELIFGYYFYIVC